MFDRTPNITRTAYFPILIDKKDSFEEIAFKTSALAEREIHALINLFIKNPLSEA